MHISVLRKCRTTENRRWRKGETSTRLSISIKKKKMFNPVRLRNKNDISDSSILPKRFSCFFFKKNLLKNSKHKRCGFARLCIIDGTIQLTTDRRITFKATPQPGRTAPNLNIFYYRCLYI